MAYSAFSIKWHCSHLLLISTHKTGFLCAERWRRWVLAGQGVRKQPSEWWTFRRHKSQTLTTVAGSREYGIVLQTLLGLRCFWISCPPPVFPLVLLLCAVLLFFMISSLLKDTCCESLVLAWGEWLTEWKTAFDVVRLDFISLSHKFDMKSVLSGWNHMDIGGQCQTGWWCFFVMHFLIKLHLLIYMIIFSYFIEQWRKSLSQEQSSSLYVRSCALVSVPKL